MTKAEIITATRDLLQVYSTDTGATLTDTVLGRMVDDAMREVVLDLLPFMKTQFMTTETVTLVAAQANYTLTSTTWLQLYKIEVNVTGHTPHEIDIIDPLSKTFVHTVGETSGTPEHCYFLGNVLYFVPTPSTATTGYARLYLVEGEPATMATAGPTYIPAIAHDLIAYKAAWNGAIAYEVGTANFKELYAKRLAAVQLVWAGRFQQGPRFVREGSDERTTRDTRESAFYDRRWLD